MNARNGSLALEERPRTTLPPMDFLDLGIHDSLLVVEGPTNLLSYLILIHLCKLWDYWTRHDDFSRGSSDSNQNDIPSNGPDDNYSWKLSFGWSFAFEYGWRPVDSRHAHKRPSPSGHELLSGDPRSQGGTRKSHDHAIHGYNTSSISLRACSGFSSDNHRHQDVDDTPPSTSKSLMVTLPLHAMETLSPRQPRVTVP